LLLLGVLGVLAGCNTMHGFGEDMQQGGEKIQERSAR
jgi:predicted small secreted protein